MIGRHEDIGFVIYKRGSSFVVRLQVAAFGVATRVTTVEVHVYNLLPLSVFTSIQPEDDPRVSKHDALMNIRI